MDSVKGKLLEIDLSSGCSKEIKLDDNLIKKYIGGRGLGVKLLYDLLPENIDPLGEENIMLILTGPMTGSIIPGGGKYVVITKSPVTGGFLDSYSSGRLAPELKFAGYDGLIIRGKAKKPSYILIEDERVQIKDANHLWGKDAFEAEEMLQPEGSKEYGTMCIGPAGENLVNFASINSDFFRQAARGGIGAVMGSKKLKAIKVRGTKDIKCYDSEGLMDLVLEHKKKLQESAVVENRQKFGTPSTLDITNEAGMLPTKNYQTGVYKKAWGKLDSEGVSKNIIKTRGCYGCMIACSQITKNEDEEIVEGPEYETVGMFGPNLGVDSLSAVIKANIKCDKLGMDTISAGNVIGFTMECYEKGILPEKYNDIDLEFGNFEAALSLLDDIALRRGIGELMAKGVEKMAEELKEGSEHFAMHVKGLEFPAYDPRIGLGTALSYAVSPRGACHRRAWPPSIEVLGNLEPYKIEGKAEYVKEKVDENSIFHSMLVCDFPAKWIPLSIEDFADYLNLLTGEDFTEKELWETADRIETMIRLFNNREGLSREDDNLPPRVLKDALPEGPTKGNVVNEKDLNTLLDKYYKIRGWNKKGIPFKNTLQKLKITDIAEGE
ncbi:MAG: aldehyde ferredoxin oxidoreductase family protein [Bacillota bacterium]